MSTEGIYQKYVGAVQQVTGDGTWVDWGVMRLALRLAVQDAHDAGLQACSGMADDLAAITANQETALQNALEQIDQLRAARNSQPNQPSYELLVAQIERLNEWLEVNAVDQYFSDNDTATAVIVTLDGQHQQIEGLRQQLAQMDADNAGLLRKVKELDSWKEQSLLTQDLLRKQAEEAWHFTPTAASTASGGPAVAVTSPAGASTPRIAAPPAASPAGPATNDSASPVTTSGAAWRSTLEAESNDWVVSIEAGRRTWRQIPKNQRLLIFQAIARHLGSNGAMPTQAVDDERKPAWMPTGTSIAMGFNCTWSELLTVTPAEVAP
jgi:uncharacterized FlaG/YvyC family protein